MSFDVTKVRAQFPSLNQEIDGKTPIFLDNPAGTQVPQRVIDAVSNYYKTMNANSGGVFPTSQRTDAMMQDARQIMADFLVADSPSEIVFGPNMTTLNFALSRAIAKTLPDDAEIVLTKMDHDANVAPWLTIADDLGLTVRWAEFDVEDGTLDMDSLRAAINEKTKIVAAVHASNALGTVNPVSAIADAAHEVGALFVMDAVQSAPHELLDVNKIGCDFLLCSAYKFFGPHIGIMWGRYDLLESLPAYKVRPSKDKAPYRWETGTPSFETIAATAEAVRYMGSFADDTPVEGYDGQRAQLKNAMANIKAYEQTLAKQLLDGLLSLPKVTIAGVTDTNRLDERVATISFTVNGYHPDDVQGKLGEQGIYLWSGDYYAVEAMRHLGRSEQGMVRVGAVHYNTSEEIDTFLNAIEAL